MTSTIDIRGLRAGYLTTGEGPDVVLMHGWGCDHTIWKSVQEHLSGAGFRTTSLDFPGFGASDEPPTPWAMADYAAWFEQFLKALGIETPILVGHSFGGRVAIVHASGNATKKVVLVDSAGVKPRRSPKYYAKVWSFKALKRLAPLFLGREKAQKLIDARRKKAGSADYNAASPTMRATLSRVVNEDLRRFMPRITAPTLLIWGAGDTATPVADARVMEKKIPDSGLVVFPGAGHYSFLDAPGQFHAILDSFFNS